MPGAGTLYETRPRVAPDGQPWALQPGQAFNAPDA